MTWIAHLARDEGKTIVLTTHQLDVAQQLSGRIVVIRQGSIIADLPTSELLSRDAKDRFEARVAGSLNGTALPAGATAQPDGETTRITLPGTDSVELDRLLRQLEAASVSLVSVGQAQPSLEEIFLRLLGGAA